MKKPPGTRSTIGAAKRLCVRQRIVPQSLICSVAGSAYLRNWISGTGISPASAMPTARPTMPSSLRRRVEHALAAELLLQAERHRMHAALRADVLAEHARRADCRQLLVEHAADRGDHVDALALRLRLVVVDGALVAGVPLAADLLHLAVEEDVVGYDLGRGNAARLGFGTSRTDFPRDLALEPLPVLVADLEGRAVRLELGQRIARPFRGNLRLGLVALRVLEAVTFEPRNGQAQQCRRTLRADVPHRFVDQPRRLVRVRAVTVEDGQP